MKHGPALICHGEKRRHEIRKRKGWNGLDYVEVSDDQLHLTVYFLGQAPEDIRQENIVIAPCGGGRPVQVVELKLCLMENEERDDCMHLRVERPGGFTPYRLCVVEVDEKGRPTDRPFHGFDRRYHCVEFSFKVNCPSDFDCGDLDHCPPEARREPAINYLAKDYASFRQLILDRLALTMPEWRERHVPDLGIALVELLAYVGDHLSYYQDAVATEAYLDTARRRISVRRHVRLVDYPMHDGCNARAWVFVETSGDQTVKDFYFITGFDPAPPAGKPLADDDLRNVAEDRYLVFEPVQEGPVAFREAHNEIRIYTWDDTECCLPKGATRATLLDEWLETEAPQEPKGYGKKGYGDDDCGPEPPLPPRKRKLDLKAGDFLLFEEVLGPKTGNPADADLSHRHVVRLTRVELAVDELHDLPVLEIEWSWEDALPFPLCISAVGGEDCRLLDPVSVARGNVLLADHGRWVKDDAFTVPAGEGKPHCEGEGRLSEIPQTAGKFHLAVRRAPLTCRQPVDPGAWIPASHLLSQDPRRAVPEIEIGGDWSARRDLLESGPGDFHFVAELDDDGRAQLRFGNGETGFAPLAGTEFQPLYRVGNGRGGNVGAESIRHLALKNNQSLSGVSLSPRNPLPARGGTDPEPLAEVRLLAPHAFRKDLQRAITADDYARLVERDFAGRVQRAAAVLRWTGSWAEVLVAVDPFSHEADVDSLLKEIEAALQRYRRIGHDVVVSRAVAVPLFLELFVCVRSSYVRGHVQEALQKALRGFFQPDNLSFGQGIALSRLIAAAQAVTGVESVKAVKFQRLHDPAGDELEKGFLPLSPLEIAQLDNDRRFPDNGRIELTMRGGR